jgi:deazaflavin-dependent oxidoreductase (nitroreductase family)
VNLLLKLYVKAHVLLYRVSRGRRGATLSGQPVILLTTRGRKTGKRRTVPLATYVENNRMYVMASLAGAPNHPAWFLNLQSNPDVEVQHGASQLSVRARVVSSEEREYLWPRIAAIMPDYDKYQAKTTRVIPVVELGSMPAAG